MILPNSRNVRAPIGFCVIALLGLAVGCGDSKNDGKAEVSGSVTWKGAPLEEGSIVFRPAEGGETTGGKIEGGKFRLHAIPGTHNVEIRAEKRGDFDPVMNQENIIQFLPEKYNAETTLQGDVVADGENSFSFDLTE